MQDQKTLIVGGTGGNKVVDVDTRGAKNALAVEMLDASGAQITDFISTAGILVPYDYDYISLSYTGANITTVVYKTGGASGSTVASLTLTYDGSNRLTSVTRS